MDQLDNWLQRISEGKIDHALQIGIADKILELLDQKKDSLGEREKMLFAQAVTALSTSVNSIYQPNESGLRRCLKILQKLLSPEDENDETKSQTGQSEQIYHAMLVRTVEIIRAEIAKNC